ncbi:hypothetical protein AMS68_003800 [Peltaster fructicola]|uniref:Uncharacterized protein n=1 Tax=Peltaster fructicola TaxID=286661 RepID=A0A6H0XU81_9PEZI|nr:hypothetical protein AMS68_003800 [Peltaster fructicola]
MARSRPRQPDLTESWDELGSSDSFDSQIYTHDDEKKEMGSQYLSSQDMHSQETGSQCLSSQDIPSQETTLSTEDDERATRGRTPRNAIKKSVRLETPEEEQEGVRRRTTRSGAGPQLVMPSSPDAVREDKKGAKLRAQTPHFRLNQRSMTSDAGFHRHQSAQGTTESNSIAQIILAVLSWALDIVRIAVNNPIVKYGFAAWLVVGIAIMGKNYATDSLYSALSPLCRLPMVPYLNLPFCESYLSGEIHGPAEFDKLMQAQAQFEDVLSSSAHGVMLPLDMKRSEAGIRDVREVVQYSSLPSRNELVFEFGNFIEGARQAGLDLSRFNMRIGHAVDRILSTNRWTLQVIEGVADHDASRGSITGFISDNLNVFAPFQTVALSRDTLLDQYLRHTSAVEEQVLVLIENAELLLRDLEHLDNRLDVIASIVARDGITVEGNKEALFATLWTKLGGNRLTVAKLEKQLKLLREVGQYRKLAWAHVSGTIVKLQAIQHQLEDLRERVALPETVGYKVPLEVHIQNINLGIERLERERDASRRIGDEATGRWSSSVNAHLLEVRTASV